MELQSYISCISDTLPTFSLAGEVHVPSPNKHFERTPQNRILYIITDGTMQIIEDTKLYTLTAGDIIIFSPGKCHCGILTNDHVDYYYIHFYWNSMQDITMTSEEYIHQKANRQTFSPDHPACQDTLILPKYFHPTHSCFNEITNQTQHLLKTCSTSELHQQPVNNALLFILLLQMSRSELSRILHTGSDNLSLPFQICDYLKTHYSQKITGAVLENIFHHNFDYMNRRFKQYTGMTIFTFLENYKIEQSKKLLQSRQFTISEIAETLGFCNPFYFNRVFKKHEKITPKEYQMKL